MSSRARDYNDSATGARSNPATQSGQAPALERTMPDGSTRLVKFDGEGKGDGFICLLRA
jgi:filamentous hemagglutinin